MKRILPENNPEAMLLQELNADYVFPAEDERIGPLSTSGNFLQSLVKILIKVVGHMELTVFLTRLIFNPILRLYLTSSINQET